MKHTRILAILIVLLLTLSMLGCSTGKLAAKVGDQEITVKQLESSYNNNSAYASYYGYALDTAEGVESFQDYLLESMLRSLVVAYEARSNGISLTEEEQKTAKENADKSYEETYKTFLDAAEQSGSADKTAYAQKLFTDTLVKNGMTVSKLKKQMHTEAEDTILIEKYRKQILEPVQMGEEEIKKLYDEQLALQKEEITADPKQYFSLESAANYGYGYPLLYVPEGLFYVKHILVEDEATAKEVQQKLNDGGDFEALLKEYGTDPGTESNPDGYVMGEGANYVEEFLNGSLALEKEGDVSDLIQSSYGYHIIKRYADVPSGETTYADVQEAFKTYAQNNKDTETYNAKLAEWMADPAVVTRYPENYRYIGKEAMEAAAAAATAEPVTETNTETEAGAE